MTWTIENGALGLLVPSRYLETYAGGIVGIERVHGQWKPVAIFDNVDKAREWVAVSTDDTCPPVKEIWQNALNGATDSMFAAIRGKQIICHSTEAETALRGFFSCVCGLLHGAEISVKRPEQEQPHE